MAPKQRDLAAPMVLATLPYPHIDPVLVHLGPLGDPLVRAGLYRRPAAGLVGHRAGPARRKSLWTAPPFNGKPPATEDQIGDLVVWATLGVILGGRLGWDLFYGTFLCSVSPDADFCRGLPTAFVTNPIKLIAAWEGGMSFHGGLIGVVVAVWLFCRRHKLELARASPIWPAPSRRSGCSSAASPISSMANCGAGSPTCPGRWCFPAPDHLPRHPSQLYEAAHGRHCCCS